MAVEQLLICCLLSSSRTEADLAVNIRKATSIGMLLSPYMAMNRQR